MKIKSGVTSVLIFFAACMGQWAFAQNPGIPLSSQIPTQQEVRPLTNTDVVEMVNAGLSPEVVTAKIRHSPVTFDVSTKGLIELKNAAVPESIVTLMISRPVGNPVVYEAAPTTESEVKSLTIKEMKDISTVYVKAPTEVLRANAESVISREGGPTINPTGVGYDAVLIIGVDCGEQTKSLWSGANYCTCEGSMTVESGNKRLWATTDRERSANAAKSSRKMVERMAEKFVEDWRDAKKGKS
jgi:hypothetical protein